jgi:ElaB/YqjD/DUF883 family membrane-anchored ribosome-binding protein
MAPRIVPEVDTSDMNEQLNSLRAELSNLSSTVSDMVKSQANGAISHMKHAASDAAATGARVASQASQSVRTSGAELESYIERNPWNSILIAGGIGLMLGLFTRSQR